MSTRDAVFIMGIDSPWVLLEFAGNVLADGVNVAPKSTALGRLSEQVMTAERAGFCRGHEPMVHFAAKALKMVLIVLFDRGNNRGERAKAVARQLGYSSVPTYHTWEPLPSIMDPQDMGPFFTGLAGDPASRQEVGAHNLRRFHGVGIVYTWGITERT
jgi:hypothetical protein